MVSKSLFHIKPIITLFIPESIKTPLSLPPLHDLRRSLLAKHSRKPSLLALSRIVLVQNLLRLVLELLYLLVFNVFLHFYLVELFYFLIHLEFALEEVLGSAGLFQGLDGCCVVETRVHKSMGFH